ncbi:MAG: hypothetical protein H6737_12945 [Alphaproteobacteria bacterium]|nr:hypothetical protein [Alphaproteobacteria bacterium]
MTPNELAIRKPLSIGPHGVRHVRPEAHEYAVDPDLAGKDGTLSSTATGSGSWREAGSTPTCGSPPSRCDRRILPSAKPSFERCRAAVGSTRDGNDLLDLGGGVEAFLTELCHRDPNWDEAVAALHALLQQHGPDAMRHAFRAAADVRCYDAAYVAGLFGARRRVAAK